MSASDPADEATGVVGDDSPRRTAPAGPEDAPSATVDAPRRARSTSSTFGADALFAEDAPPPSAPVTGPLPVSPTALDALFTGDSTPASDASSASAFASSSASESDASSTSASESGAPSTSASGTESTSVSEPVSEPASEPASASESESASARGSVDPGSAPETEPDPEATSMEPGDAAAGAATATATASAPGQAPESGSGLESTPRAPASAGAAIATATAPGSVPDSGSVAEPSNAEPVTALVPEDAAAEPETPATAPADLEPTDEPTGEAASAATPPLTKPSFTPETTAPVEADHDAANEPPSEAADAQWADDTTPATALTWVDPATVAANTLTPTLEDDQATETGGGLLRGAKLRPEISRPRILVPLGVLAALVAVYAGTTLLWPLNEVPPTVHAVEVAPVPTPAATFTWPAQGSASVGIAGLSTSASTPNAVSIASITKVVSSLMVLDRMPLAVGEQGPEFSFTLRDSYNYWDYRRSDQSALDVPVGGVLTEYQMLQGTLMGSANNYIDRLASEIWGSNEEFARAAKVWLSERGLSGITVVTPSGFDEGNVATPEALIALGERAMQNPVFAEIVGTVSVDLPGAGTVVNTNGMLADPGVVGIKTGTLVGWNLLTAKDVTVGDSTVHLFAAVLDQADDAARLAATRNLFAQAEAALQAQAPAVPKGTVVGQVTTPWGEKVDVITDDDADVVLWNGAAATTMATFDLGGHREEDDTVGTLTTAGPIDTTTTKVVLAEDVEGPSPWWRLTHPLDLLGITAD